MIWDLITGYLYMIWDPIWDLIVSVPDHCLSFYFIYIV